MFWSSVVEVISGRLVQISGQTLSTKEPERTNQESEPVSRSRLRVCLYGHTSGVGLSVESKKVLVYSVVSWGLCLGVVVTTPSRLCVGESEDGRGSGPTTTSLICTGITFHVHHNKPSTVGSVFCVSSVYENHSWMTYGSGVNKVVHYFRTGDWNLTHLWSTVKLGVCPVLPSRHTCSPGRDWAGVAPSRWVFGGGLSRKSWSRSGVRRSVPEKIVNPKLLPSPSYSMSEEELVCVTGTVGRRIPARSRDTGNRVQTRKDPVTRR